MMTDLPPSKRILLIVSGGIACYKAAELLRLLIKRGCDVECILTAGAREFVTPLLFAGLSGKKIHTELFSAEDESRMGHIALARGADAILIAPATAHIIAKTAHGLADDLATTALLATTAPVYIAPAMNPAMYASSAVQANLNLLQARGAFIIPPENGLAACGESGEGRLRDPADIADMLLGDRTSGIAKGLHVLITSGATRERLDPVRYLTNFSSGKQGAALADAWLEQGARVTYIHGTGAAQPAWRHSPLFTAQEADTAETMLAACMAVTPPDIVICAAAVCDWRPLYNNPKKVKKTDGEDRLTVVFSRTTDILQELCARPSALRSSLIIGFAAETADDDAELIALAQQKMARKRCDMIIANNVSSGVFGEDDNCAVILTADGTVTALGQRTKRDTADAIVCEAMKRFNHREHL